MTKDELKQIYYLDNEIKMWQKELESIYKASLIKSPIISNEPIKINSRKDIVGEIAVKITDIESIIKDKLQQIELQKERILKYIYSIDDSLIRQIIYYRDIKLMSWRKVAQKIGGNNTEDSVRKSYIRFINKN